jgi:predicted amidophosphoribosyltransferase
LPYHEARSLFAHSGDVRSAILAAKYSGRPFPARAVARRLEEAFRGHWKDLFPYGPPPTIVPVPVHPVKYFRRGFNLPALVGAELARRLRWRCDPLALFRRPERLPQAGLPSKDRDQNVAGAFYSPEGKAAPTRVLLLDDVFTTGATARAAASALKSAGADHIVVVTISRTEHR